MPELGPGESVVWSGTMNDEDQRSGILYLTNRRVFFEYRKGTFKRRVIVVAETPLDDVTSMSIEKGPWNWNVLVVASRDRTLRFMFRGERPDALMDKISETIAKHKTASQ